MDDTQKLIELLNLSQHPEGGYFKEVYRSEEVLPHASIPPRYKSDRNFSTSIYFMLCRNQVSHFHRIQSDEIWHYYKGSPIILHCLNQNGYTKTIVGNNIFEGELPQHTIKAGTWFAAEVADKTSFTLLGCTVAPGFDFADFELANADNLINLFSNQRELILRLSIK